MARVEVKLAQWGMGMSEGVVLEWHKQVGDTVEAGDDLVEIEAAKATGSVQAPEPGRIVEILADVDDEVPVGDVLCVIET
jgi:pyruvate/2-oxoglutarate dehydrogenase complex dihydrolipoamide acyltransferase (E2) component